MNEIDLFKTIVFNLGDPKIYCLISLYTLCLTLMGVKLQTFWQHQLTYTLKKVHNLDQYLLLLKDNDTIAKSDHVEQ